MIRIGLNFVRKPSLSFKINQGLRYYTSGRKYGKNEDWFDYKDKVIEVGITQKAIGQLGDLVFIEFQHDNGDIVEKDEDLVIVESVKATDSIKAPFNCKLLENNLSLEEDLDNLNKDVENTWIIKISEIDN